MPNFLLYGYLLPLCISAVLGFLKGRPDGFSWAMSAVAVAIVPLLNILFALVLVYAYLKDFEDYYSTKFKR